VLYQTDEARLFPVNGLHKHYIDEPVTFVDGKKYNVVLDGTTYECVAVSVAGPDGASSVALGNIHLAIPDFADTGEPFMIVPEDASHYAVWSQNGFKIVKISTMEEKVGGYDFTMRIDETGAYTCDRTFDEIEQMILYGGKSACVMRYIQPTENHDGSVTEKTIYAQYKGTLGPETPTASMFFEIMLHIDYSSEKFNIVQNVLAWYKSDNSLKMFMAVYPSAATMLGSVFQPANSNAPA
jgi:hypothetical protein